VDIVFIMVVVVEGDKRCEPVVVVNISMLLRTTWASLGDEESEESLYCWGAEGTRCECPRRLGFGGSK